MSVVTGNNGINRLVEWAVGALYLLTVLFVLALAGKMALAVLHRLMLAATPAAIIRLLDPLLVLMMLAELLHTVALVLQTHHLPLRPLLALVFMAVLRHAVVLASTMTLASVNAAATLAGLVILTVLLLNIPSHDAD